MSVSIWNAIILGLVQGIAEFLPISSSGHLSILQNLFHMSTTENGHLFFDVLLHLGTLISICIVYWRDIVAMVRETFAFFRNTRLPAAQRQQELPAARMVLMIIRATLPLFLILPIIAVLPHADTFFTDAGSGFIQNICIRTNRRHYYIAKYTATFLSGGTVTTIPFLLNFLLSCLVLPAMHPEASAFTSSIGEASTFPHLFFNLPLLYVGVYFLIIFVFCGLLATISLISSYFAGYRFLVVLTPFLLYLTACAIFQLIGLADWQPINLLDPSYPGNTLVAIFVECILLILFTQYGFIVKGAREDIF